MLARAVGGFRCWRRLDFRPVPSAIYQIKSTCCASLDGRAPCVPLAGYLCPQQTGCTTHAPQDFLPPASPARKNIPQCSRPPETPATDADPTARPAHARSGFAQNAPGGGPGFAIPGRAPVARRTWTTPAPQHEPALAGISGRRKDDARGGAFRQSTSEADAWSLSTPLILRITAANLNPGSAAAPRKSLR